MSTEVREGHGLRESVDWELLGEWLRHPVTKVIFLCIAAHVARELVITHGARLLGLVDDEAGDL